MNLYGKSSQVYPVDIGAPQGSILDPTLFRLYTNDLPDGVICNIAAYAVDTTIYSKCDQASDLRQQLKLAFELESNLRDSVYWGKECLFYFNTAKTKVVSFGMSNDSAGIDVKINGSVLEEKNHHLRCWDNLSLLNCSYIASIAKTALTKIGARLLFIFTNLP